MSGEPFADGIMAERDSARRELAALRDGVQALLGKWCNEDGDVEFESGFGT